MHHLDEESLEKLVVDQMVDDGWREGDATAFNASYAIDLVVFVNGLPIFTFELKNNITKQTVEDAVAQYQRDRDPRDLLFGFGRTLAHFALDGVSIDQLHPLLDRSAHEYIVLPDEDDQVKFKGNAKAFLRTYNFLATVLPYGSVEWEKRAIFLDNLVPKLPAPKDEDLSAGILENIDLESYRAEKSVAMRIVLDDEDGTLEPMPANGAGMVNDPALEKLSTIVKSFNDHFGNIEWEDEDRIQRRMTEEIPRLVAEDEAYRNAQANGDPVTPASRATRHCRRP